MFPLKPLHRNAVPAALEKAQRYRLLNEAREAESICRDVLAADPENDEARTLLILALTDQFAHRLAATWGEASSLVAAFDDPYARAYYRGILHERRAKAGLKNDRVGAHMGAYEDFRHAMECYEEAAAAAPDGDDSALLRWNTCARILNSDPSLQPAPEAAEPTLLE